MKSLFELLTDKHMFRIEVDGLPPSLNQFYSGMHWAKRKKVVDEWHTVLAWALKEAKVPKIDGGITLNVTQYCKRTVRDADNAVISAKLMNDTLVALGLIEDDKLVKPVILDTKSGKRDKQVFIIIPT